MSTTRASRGLAPPPAVSIDLPYFEGWPFLARAIASVQSQTCADHDFVVVDDGSTDRALELLRGSATREHLREWQSLVEEKSK